MDSIPWPELGDELFVTDGDAKSTASLACFGPWDWSQYAASYLAAVDLLVDQAIGKRPCERDQVVHPCIFLYRQHLELMMKQLIETGLQAFPELRSEASLQKGVPNTHKLDRLWGYCDRILRQMWPKGPEEELRAVGRCVREFSRIDPGSYTFRYPVDTEGRSWEHGLMYVCLANLRQTMEKLDHFFGGAIDGIQHAIDSGP